MRFPSSYNSTASRSLYVSYEDWPALSN